MMIRYRNILVTICNCFLLHGGRVGMVAVLLLLPWFAFAQTSYTSKVSNTYTAWGGQKTYKAGTVTCAEYFSTSHFYNNAFAQEVSGLPVGVYTAEIYFNASTTQDVDKVVDDGTKGYTYLIAGDQEVDIPVYNTSTITEPTLYTVENIHVTDGTLRLGSRNSREAANWHLIRLKSLKYLGVDSVSLFYGLFPLIRQGRDQWELCTCMDYRNELDTWINKALAGSIADNTSVLQEIYDGLDNAISSSQKFEKSKTSAKKNLAYRISTWHNTWNTGTKVPTEEQWAILRPALVGAVLAKDQDCSYTVMTDATTALKDAMNEAATGVDDITSDNANTHEDYIGIDGVRTSSPAEGHIYIKSGRKILQSK